MREKQIIARRDPRYDGRFLYGVKTTGIYCRPICPAKPNPENIVIFRNFNEAEDAGYRACMRCHPNLAPGLKMPRESERLVSRALKLIKDVPNEGLSVRRLAESVGVTERHLRRVFDKQLGTSPVETLIARRLDAAKRMMRDTAMPITGIAFEVGFQSVRGFNEAFRKYHGISPSTFRRKRS